MLLVLTSGPSKGTDRVAAGLVGNEPVNKGFKLPESPFDSMVVPESPIEFQSAAPTSTLKKPIFPIRAPTLSGNEDQGVRRDRKGTTRRGFERSSAAIADQTARETPFNIHSRFYLIPGEWHGVENVAIVSGGAPSSTHWGADHWTPLIPLDGTPSDPAKYRRPFYNP